MQAKDAADKLAAKVIKGGSGVWGPVPMPANPQVNEAEAKKLVAWVLAEVICHPAVQAANKKPHASHAVLFSATALPGDDGKVGTAGIKQLQKCPQRCTVTLNFHSCWRLPLLGCSG
jgi:hypothetical protein